jgi:ferredoxin
MEEHLIDFCCNMKGSCSNCKQEIIRSDLDTHICKQSPEKTIAAQALEIQRLKQENANKNQMIHDYITALSQR